MKNKLLKYIKKLQNKKVDKTGEAVYKITFVDKSILFAFSIISKLLVVGTGALIINAGLFLLKYNFTLKTYLGSIGVYFIVYEIKSWVDNWRNKE